jgi:hypothetical protein
MNRADPVSSVLDLRAGEWVEVRSAKEILATLDAKQALEGLPFMPEMLQYCGQRFRVYKSAHKTCDTIKQYVIHKMDSTVHLENLRCDGSGHDGCQAKCLIFWKEAWLKRVPDGASTSSAPVSQAVFDRLLSASRAPADPVSGEPRYRCQATDMLKATTLVRRRERWDPRFYIKDLTSRNVTIGQMLGHGAHAAFNAFTRKWFNWRYPPLKGLAKGKTPTAALNIQPGELVQVRSKAEIMQTLSPELRNRGLWFDIEMVAHCNSTFRVLDRVEKIVDEKTGKMMRMANPCLILDGVICTGHNAIDRMFCPRAIYPYWREVWVKRVGT